MTQPNPDQGNQGDSKPAPKPASVKVLDVVEYLHHDLLTGRDVTHVGVVVRADKGDQTAAVRPLSHHHLEVGLADITPISADEID